MKAAILHKVHEPLSIEDIEVPSTAEDEVLVSCCLSRRLRQSGLRGELARFENFQNVKRGWVITLDDSGSERF